MNDDFPEARPTRPVWLMTLADLALLLVGFFVFVQATQGHDRRAQAQGFRDAFTHHSAPEPMPLAAAAVLDFAPGSAVLAAPPAAAAAWAREASRDPRVAIRIAGLTDGTAADVDPGSGSAAVLAADRARTVAAALAGSLPAGRVTIVNAPETMRGRRVLLTLGFQGTPPTHPARSP